MDKNLYLLSISVCGSFFNFNFDFLLTRIKNFRSFTNV